MITVKFKSGSTIRVGSPREADKLRGRSYPQPESYTLSFEDYTLLRYLHNEVLMPAVAAHDVIDYE